MQYCHSGMYTVVCPIRRHGVGVTRYGTRGCVVQVQVYDFSFAGGEFDCKTFLEKYTDRFLGDVDPHEIARRLEIKKVISQNVCSKLLEAGKLIAVDMLYCHMRDHGSLETVHTLCDVMIDRDGLPNMNKLGRDMKQDLPVSCMWCNMYMHVHIIIMENCTWVCFCLHVRW